MDRALCRRMHPPTSRIQSTSCHWKVHYEKKYPMSFPCSCICNLLKTLETRPTHTVSQSKPQKYNIQWETLARSKLLSLSFMYWVSFVWYIPYVPKFRSKIESNKILTLTYLILQWLRILFYSQMTLSYVALSLWHTRLSLFCSRVNVLGKIVPS